MKQLNNKNILNQRVLQLSKHKTTCLLIIIIIIIIFHISFCDI